MDSIDNIVALTSMAYLIVSLIPVSHHGTNIISTVCRQPTVFHSPTHLDPYLVPISLHELITQSLPQFLHIRVREGSTQQVLKQCHSVTSICHNLYHTEIQDNLVIHQLTHARTHARTHTHTPGWRITWFFAAAPRIRCFAPKLTKDLIDSEARRNTLMRYRLQTVH